MSKQIKKGEKKRKKMTRHYFFLYIDAHFT